MNAPSRDPKPYADFILKYLLRPLHESDGAACAVTETEHPADGDLWFWVDDNAKALELLATPEVWRERSKDLTGILQFVRSLCDGPFIFRRIAGPRLESVKIDDESACFVHGLMDVVFDRKAGKLDLGMRFHDGRTARNIRFAGNYVRFRHRGRDHFIGVESGLFENSVRREPDRIVFSWTSRIMFDADAGRFRRKQRLELGVVTYVATVHANSMFVNFEATLDLDPSVEASDVVLSFAFDDISTDANNVRYEDVAALLPDGAVRTQNGGDAMLEARGATYWRVSQRSQLAAFALAVHNLPQAGAPFVGVRVVRHPDGALHWAASEYVFAGGCRGRLRAAETKIITSGGFYDEVALYESMLRKYAERPGAPHSVVDLSISYDYGAEARALAKCYRTLNALGDAARDEVKALFDQIHRAYGAYFIAPFATRPAAIFSRSIAFTAFAYADMLEATGAEEYRGALRTACEIVASFERVNDGIGQVEQSGFLMGRDEESAPYADCHCACLLALAKGTRALDVDAWLAAIDRGLAAFRYDTVEISFLGPKKQDTIGIDYLTPRGERRTLDTFWNFSAGIALRLFNELRKTDHPGLRDVWARHAPRLEGMERFMIERISRSIRPRENTLEIVTSVLSSETNSETQPWVALALIGEC